PAEKSHAQAASTSRERIEERAQFVGQAVVRALRHETHAAVDVPSQKLDRVLRGGECLAHRAETRGAVDQEGEAMGRFNAPAVAPGLENRHGFASRHENISTAK